MSLVQQMPDRRIASGNSQGIPMNLSSNNPFRRAVSPHPLSPDKIQFPRSADNNATMSRNPFLDPPSANLNAMPSHDMTANKMADDIFKDFSTLDRPVTNTGAPRTQQSQRSGTVRQRDDGSRPSRSRPNKDERSIFDTPPKSTRPRRNSDSSIMDSQKTEDDRRRRERRRERERQREKDAKPKDSKSSRPTKKPHGLDVIDKLDVTGIYGQGLFHHDGPFDACNPHRNRKNNQKAPMSAFPENSANNALGGGAPKTFDYDRFHGRGHEGFNDFAATAVNPASTTVQEYTTSAPHPEFEQRKPRTQISFNPTDRVEQVHGDESEGLGTSTFLDGAPAPRAAVQRRGSERDDYQVAPPIPSSSGGNMGGLGRKKSLAMRIRGISNARRPGEVDSGKGTSPDAYARVSPRSPSGTQSAGGPMKARPMRDEKNPFFNNENYDEAYEKKGAQIHESQLSSGRARAPSSPGAGPALTRSITADSGNPYGEGIEEKPASGGGFLSRMKSIKGGRRTRPERRAS